MDNHISLYGKEPPFKRRRRVLLLLVGRSTRCVMDTQLDLPSSSPFIPNLLSLPPDVLVNCILARLPLNDMIVCDFTCRRLRELITRNRVLYGYWAQTARTVTKLRREFPAYAITAKCKSQLEWWLYERHYHVCHTNVYGIAKHGWGDILVYMASGHDKPSGVSYLACTQCSGTKDCNGISMTGAAASGSISTIELLLCQPFFAWNYKCTTTATEHGHLRVLKHIEASRRYDVSSAAWRLFVIAQQCGNTEIADWLNDKYISEEITRRAQQDREDQSSEY